MLNYKDVTQKARLANADVIASVLIAMGGPSTGHLFSGSKWEAKIPPWNAGYPDYTLRKNRRWAFGKNPCLSL